MSFFAKDNSRSFRPAYPTHRARFGAQGARVQDDNFLGRWREEDDREAASSGECSVFPPKRSWMGHAADGGEGSLSPGELRSQTRAAPGLGEDSIG